MTAPDLVLVGDSIRLSYEPHVRAALPGRRVWGPAENCQSTRFLLNNLEGLVLERLQSPSIVHLNAGAHDLRRWPEAGHRVQVDLEEYEANLAEIADRLLRNDLVDQLVFATTTPVIDDRHESGRFGRRRNDDVIAYNERLVSVATAHDLLIDDLYSVVVSGAVADISEDGIHLREPGAELVGRAVASFLTGAFPA